MSYYPDSTFRASFHFLHFERGKMDGSRYRAPQHRQEIHTAARPASEPASSLHWSPKRSCAALNPHQETPEEHLLALGLIENGLHPTPSSQGQVTQCSATNSQEGREQESREWCFQRQTFPSLFPTTYLVLSMQTLIFWGKKKNKSFKFHSYLKETVLTTRTSLLIT